MRCNHFQILKCNVRNSTGIKIVNNDNRSDLSVKCILLKKFICIPSFFTYFIISKHWTSKKGWPFWKSHCCILFDQVYHHCYNALLYFWDHFFHFFDQSCISFPRLTSQTSYCRAAYLFVWKLVIIAKSSFCLLFHQNGSLNCN